jgi:hypothetical protein
VARRRRSRFRNLNARFLVVLVLLLFLLGLVINGIVSGARSSSDYETLSNQSFALQANSISASQAIQGQQFTSILVNGPGMSRADLGRQLEALVTSTDQSAQQARIAGTSAASNGVAPKYAQVVIDRAQGVAQSAHAIEGLLGLTAVPGTSSNAALLSSAQATNELAQAGALIAQADATMPGLQATMAKAPGHAWLRNPPFVSDAGLLSRTSMSLFVASLSTSPTLTVVHQLSLASLSILPTPLPVGNSNATITLSPTSTIQVTLVVKNQGNVGENPVTASASVTPVQGGFAQNVHGTARVAAGGAVSMVLPALQVTPGTTVSLSVQVAPAPGQTDRAGLSQSYTVVIAPSSVTTTTRKP